MPTVAVLDHDTVLAAVSPREAIDRTREAFLRHRRGEWHMPAKVYLESPPHGAFPAIRAPPAGRLPALPRPRRGRGDPQVDLVVPGQPGAVAAHGARRPAGQRRADQ